MSAKNQAKVLVIDDDETILMQVEKILENEGFETLQAGNGKDGLEKATTESPDAIVLDRRMPEMDGNETLIQLKDDDRTKNIPVIMLTGDSRITDVSTSLELGAMDYIVKPFEAENFLSRLKKALE